MNKKQMNEVRAEVNRWYDLMDNPEWDENTTAMWAMAEEIVRLREEVARLASFLHPVGMVINTEHGAVIPKAGIEGVTDEEINEYLKAVRGE